MASLSKQILALKREVRKLNVSNNTSTRSMVVNIPSFDLEYTKDKGSLKTQLQTFYGAYRNEANKYLDIKEKNELLNVIKPPNVIINDINGKTITDYFTYMNKEQLETINKAIHIVFMSDNKKATKKVLSLLLDIAIKYNEFLDKKEQQLKLQLENELKNNKSRKKRYKARNNVNKVKVTNNTTEANKDTKKPANEVMKSVTKKDRRSIIDKFI